MENETEKELNQKKIDFMANILFYEEPKKEDVKVVSYVSCIYYLILGRLFIWK